MKANYDAKKKSNKHIRKKLKVPCSSKIERVIRVGIINNAFQVHSVFSRLRMSTVPATMVSKISKKL